VCPQPPQFQLSSHTCQQERVTNERKEERDRVRRRKKKRKQMKERRTRDLCPVCPQTSPYRRPKPLRRFLQSPPCCPLVAVFCTAPSRHLRRAINHRLFRSLPDLRSCSRSPDATSPVLSAANDSIPTPPTSSCFSAAASYCPGHADLQILRCSLSPTVAVHHLPNEPEPNLNHKAAAMPRVDTSNQHGIRLGS
jgi:hypothetical protein